MPKKQVENIIHANGVDIAILTSVADETDYISLTDIARYQSSDPYAVIQNWMRNRDTIEFLGLWEQLNNPNFNPIEFEGFKNQAGRNAFTLSPRKWISSTNAIGLISKSGRYGGGTFAHSDIAFEFASWVSPEFKLYVIKDYQRLKQDESYRMALDWNVKRILAKANYRVHTDAIKEKLIPPELSAQQQGYVYADEADMLNIILFGQTAAEWRNTHPDHSGNMRDYATIEQLIVLTNLENANALLIQQGKSQPERMRTLRAMAVYQLETFTGSKSAQALQELHDHPKLPGV